MITTSSCRARSNDKLEKKQFFTYTYGTPNETDQSAEIIYDMQKIKQTND